jgi:adenylate cyclase
MKRRLAAILAADVVGYSRLMGGDEVGTLARLHTAREEVLQPRIVKHHGRMVKLMGDGLLAEFPSAVEAVQCAVEIQDTLSERNAALPEDKRITYRIGINIGDIIVEGEDIYGDGVNVAARLEHLGQPGEICVSSAARDQVFDKVDFTLEDLGEVEVKNIARPIRIYRVAGTSPPAKVASHTSPARQDKPSIAVLPFVNMSGDPEQEYFSDGITEDIITALSRLRWFFVIARNSTFVYKGRNVDVKRVGQELGVRYVLEGSVRKAGNRIRVTAQLVDTLSGAHHWAQTYDRDLTDIFELQDDITQSVTAAIEPKLVAAEGVRSQNRSPDDLDAWDLVMRALTHYWRMNTAESDIAIKMLREAVERFPDYGPAHSMLAFAMLVSGHVGWTPESQDYEYAADVAHRAAELDDEDPWAHLALGYLAFMGAEIGASVGTPEAARLAAASGATYLGVGPIYATGSKPDAGHAIGIGPIGRLKTRVDIPLLAIGGLTCDNVEGTIRAGADGIAVISAVSQAPDMVGATAQLLQRIQAAKQARDDLEQLS